MLPPHTPPSLPPTRKTTDLRPRHGVTVVTICISTEWLEGICISTEWLVGLGRAKLTVTPYTLMRVLYVERVARLNHQALTRSICRGSTAEVAQNGCLGLSASGIVPALLFASHLFVLPGPPSLVVPWRSSPNPVLFVESGVVGSRRSSGQRLPH